MNSTLGRADWRIRLVDPNGAMAHATDGCLTAMTQVEMDVGMAFYEGLPVFVVAKEGILREAIFLAQPFLQ